MIKWHALITHLYCSEAGHRYEYHLSFRKVIKQLGQEYVGYCNRGPFIRKIPSDWEPCLDWSEQKSISEIYVRLRGFISIFRRPTAVEEQRHFFIESYSLCDVIVMILAFGFLKKTDKLFFFLRWDLRTNYMKKWKGSLYRFLFLLIKWRLGKRFVTLADTTRLVDYYSQVLKHKIYHVPILHTSDIPAIRKEESDSIDLWWPGLPKNERGPEYIHKLVKSTTLSKMRLFVSHEFPVEAAIEVCYLKAALPRKEYVQQLINSDVILLPSDPVSYYSRSSGPFVEAIFAGKVVVVREGSWLANELREHDLEELIIDFSSLDQIAQLARDPNVLKKLEKMQKHYREFHSIENFAKILSSYQITGEGKSKGSKDRRSAHPHIV